ncbi:MAG: sigma-70 family RNA polymerase sigma factor [Pseudomonadota bacterium]
MSDQKQQVAAALVEAIASGQRRALGQLIGLYSRGLTAVAARYLGREDDAEEVVQDVFVRVWRHAGRYDPARAKVSTWLYRIAVNLCIDRRRKRALLRVIGLEETEIPDPQPTPADRIDGASELAAVRGAIDTLPNRQRMALLLRAVGGLETAEVATAMGLSTGAAEQLLVRARRKLREAADSTRDGVR